MMAEMTDAIPKLCPGCGADTLDGYALGLGSDYDEQGNCTYFPYCSCGYEFRAKVAARSPIANGSTTLDFDEIQESGLDDRIYVIEPNP